ncbi:MAG TPA: hypothetical protein VHX88_04365 [Solirubrobacteraceae bacterium]|nr:hypothetical protein [Solirubrobacteraceae bacterium]
MPGAHDDTDTIAKLSNEYATVWVDLDRDDGNGPRLRVRSLRDHGEIYLDPVALSLLCEVDQELLSLLADIARDKGARTEFHAWMETRRLNGGSEGWAG